VTGKARGLAAGLMISLVACIMPGRDELPEVAEQPKPTPMPTGFARDLDAAQLRHAHGIECGTQYLFEMADLAKQADQHIPEPVSAFRAGKGDMEASTILMLMQDRALLAVPALVELANDADPGVRRRGQAALDTVFESVDSPRPTSGAG
jgi:hypothetical protein